MTAERLLLTPNYSDFADMTKNAWVKQTLSKDPFLTPPFWDQNGGDKHSSDTQGSG